MGAKKVGCIRLKPRKIKSSKLLIALGVFLAFLGWDMQAGQIVEAATPSVNYSVYVEGTKWQAAKKDGVLAGTEGKALKLESLKINITNKPYTGGVKYRSYIQGVGWESWVTDNAQSGTPGLNKRLEGFQAELYGDIELYYSLEYRAHVQSVGWQPWTENGVLAGTMGESLRIEAIQMRLVPKKLIYDSPLVVVPDDTTEIDSKYNFIAKFIPGKTTVVPFGSGWKKTRVYENDPSTKLNWWSFNPGTSTAGKGKVGVVYKNVGRYNGKDIDLKITINDWLRYTKTVGNMSYADEEISHISQGYTWVDQTWAYYESGTNNEVTMTGYMTIADIDARQGIKFSKETSLKISKIFTPLDTSRVQFENQNGEYYFYDATNKAFPTDDPMTQFTFLYDGVKSLTFKWMREYDKTNSGPDSNININQSSGEMFTYMSTKPAKTAVVPPEKRVVLPDGSEMIDSIVTNVNDEINYSIYHQVPSEEAKYYYDSYVMADILPDVLTGISVKIINQEGKDESARFNVSISGTKVTATAKNTKDAGFYDKMFTFMYTAKIDKTKMRAKLVNNEATLRNKATLSVNGKPSYSNTVTSKVTQRNITINHIDDITGKTIKTETAKLMDGEPYDYSPKTDLVYETGYNYKALSGKQSGTVNGKDIVLNFRYTRPWTITVNHIDKDTNKIIKTEIGKKYNGETYSYAPKTDLVYDSAFKYKPVSATQTGTIANKDVTLSLYYTGPRTITVNHVDKDTGTVLKTVSERKHDGESYSYAPITTFKNAAGDAYKVVSATQTGKLSGQNVTVTLYYTQPRTITVQHIDQETNKVLNTVTEKKHDGLAYSYSVKTNLVYNASFMYKPVTTTAQSGTVAGKNITLKFYYLAPRTITINHVDDDDSKVIKSETDRKHNGDKYTYAPKTDLKTSGGDAYKAVTTTQTGTVNGNMTITIRYTKPRVITIKHVDDDNNTVLKTETEKKYDGEKYSYVPKTDLKTSSGDAYKAVTATQTGTVNGATTVTIRYTKPRLITIKHVDDDTNAVLATDTDKKYDGTAYSYAVKTTLKTAGGDLYKALSGALTGTVKGDVTLTIRYTKPRVITINHVDDDDGKVIKTESEKKYDGATYSYTPRTDLKTSDNFAYIAKSPIQKGVVDGNTTVTIRYVKPRTITINHVDNDDNKVIKTEIDRKYVGDKYSYSPRTDLKTTGGDAYKGVTAVQTGTIAGHLTITIKYTKPRTITINHVDDDDSKVIKSESEKKYDGESYSYAPKTDLKTSDNFAYKAKSATQTGKVAGNTTITIRYIKPRVITINHVDNDDIKVIKTDIDRKYVGDVYEYSARTDLKTTGGDAYKGLTAVQKGTIAGHLTITIKYTKPRLLTINHVDDDTEKIIKTETTKKYDGETYTFSAKTDLLFESKYKYYALAPATLSGTVKGNQILAFRYTKPSLAIGFEKIRIKTDVAANGLPVELNFNLIKLADRWETNSATVTLVDKATSKTVYTKTVAIKDLKDGLKFTIPAAQLTHKGKHNYEAVVTTSNDKTIVVVTDQNKINTDGYIASGETLSMTSSTKAQELKFEGIAMTERVINKEIKLYNETIVATVEPSIQIKSGYGFASPQTITYATTVDNDALSDINAIGLADTIISDGNYPEKDGRNQIALSVKNTDVSKKRTTVLDVPQVFVDSEGSISLTNSPDRVDGKKRLYVDVWPEELGEQTYTVDTEPMGRNAISFELHRKVDIDAYMFNHVDSETMKDDALLITPADHMYFGIDAFIKR